MKSSMFFLNGYQQRGRNVFRAGQEKHGASVLTKWVRAGQEKSTGPPCLHNGLVECLSYDLTTPTHCVEASPGKMQTLAKGFRDFVGKFREEEVVSSQIAQRSPGAPRRGICSRSRRGRARPESLSRKRPALRSWKPHSKAFHLSISPKTDVLGQLEQLLIPAASPTESLLWRVLPARTKSEAVQPQQDSLGLAKPSKKQMSPRHGRASHGQPPTQPHPTPRQSKNETPRTPKDGGRCGALSLWDTLDEGRRHFPLQGT